MNHSAEVVWTFSFIAKESCNRYCNRLYCCHTSREERAPSESMLPWQISMKRAMTWCLDHWNHRMQHSWMHLHHTCTSPPAEYKHVNVQKSENDKHKVPKTMLISAYGQQKGEMRLMFMFRRHKKGKSCAGIRSPFSPRTARLIGWLVSHAPFFFSS